MNVHALRSRVRDAQWLVNLAAQVAQRDRRPLIAIWGNCQAAALRTMLSASAEMSAQYRIARLPGAHEVTAAQMHLVQKLLARAEVLVTQPIRNDYRGLPTGTAQVLEAANPDARIIRYPSMFYTGLHPYLVYVHATGELGTPAPLTEGYHDLRFIAAAAHGGDDSAAEKWLAETAGDHAALVANAKASLAELAQREDALDVWISGGIPDLRDRAFWTVNHPSNQILANAAAQIVHLLEARNMPPAEFFPDELLSSVIVPVHADIRAALGYEVEGSRAWIVGGRSHDDVAVLRAHLAYYRRRPEVLEVAVAEHAEPLSRFGLLT